MSVGFTSTPYSAFFFAEVQHPADARRLQMGFTESVRGTGCEWSVSLGFLSLTRQQLCLPQSEPSSKFFGVSTLSVLLHPSPYKSLSV